MTLTETLDKFPPCLCRLVARQPGRYRRMTLLELSVVSGLSYGSVRRLSLKKTWANVPPEIIDKFAGACGVDILHTKRKVFYVKRALKSPNGYKNLAAPTGHQSPHIIIQMLKSLTP